jgi:ribosomal protein S18 acetylase RimI-like enzyme
VSARFDAALLSQVEDAGLNASAPPQQRWMDGWLVRFCPGKAKRARCVNAVAAGRLPLADKLAAADALYRAAGLPLLVRITPFSEPDTLDTALEALGMTSLDDTRVMLTASLDGLKPSAWAAGLTLHPVGHEAFAQAVGRLRGSSLAQRQAHAERLALSPVPFEGWVVKQAEQGDVVACGQFAREGALVGLYDVFCAEALRGRGVATALCGALLEQAQRRGAQAAYLQVEADNLPARRVYRRLGFVDAYAYHYRQAAGSAPAQP